MAARHGAELLFAVVATQSSRSGQSLRRQRSAATPRMHAVMRATDATAAADTCSFCNIDRLT
jgi:hypothetical protein